ncbi:Gfo/Idh/MocA family oxidoreductase [Aminivibrio sp.]|uniref:Gfo/Idh/MocA family protein n=1 Tax=Aminivibrio sp. TaxID=1872489 RepID=UPI001A4A26B0|nr:Gfo/Idh/MocA family oxidoreductase [Aminivibrio sp.]MBL3540694.1 Gfo/Idh/MocA family oxidoreductase [Aminivibrio sp.]
MKVCFFGMGSIGMRHAQNLRHLLQARGQEGEIHALRSGSGGEIPEGLADRSCASWDDLEPLYDLVFITNPTAMHYETLLKAEPLGRSFFIEKPVFHSSSVASGIPRSFPEKTIHVACPLRFHPIIEHLKARLPGKVLAARLLCSSYLPDWRKGKDYRTVYSARRELGGGVALDLIHELDYARWLFGQPEKVVRVSGKYSALETDCDDGAAYIMTCGGRLVEVHLDYFGRKPRRELELICEDDTFICDLLQRTMTSLLSGETTVFPQEDLYEKEMAYFLDLSEKGSQSFNSLEDALATLRVAEGGENS